MDTNNLGKKLKQPTNGTHKNGTYSKKEVMEVVKNSGKEFTSLNRLASYICNTPVSMFNLLDQNFQFTASKFGDWDGNATQTKKTVCQFTVQKDDILVINDTLNDERTKSIKEIAGNSSLRFYAGVPINAPKGERLGAFCVIGNRPQELSQKQRQALIDLGQEVESRITLFYQKELVEKQNKELQQSVAFLENSSDIRLVLEPVTFKILEAKGVEEILGCFDTDLVGRNLFDLIKQVNIQNHIKQWTNEQADRSKLGVPVQLTTSDSEELWLDLTFTRYNEKLLATGRDITKQHRAEEQLKHSLEEKEILLSEVHHRVKNNLAVVSGLLQLERFQTEDKKILNVLRNCESRIMSIAKIHELLYQADNFANVQLEQYLQALVSNLQETYPLDSGRINIELNVSELSLNVNQALPVGLIVNELIANAIKHAFPEKQTGTITVIVLEKEPRIMTVEVSDTGMGLDMDTSDLQEKGNLGFTLIDTLVKQLNADLEIKNDHGTIFRFTFKKQDKKGSVSTL